jgi:hypothetical protein
MRVGRYKLGLPSKKLSPLAILFELQEFHGPQSRTGVGAQDFIVNLPAPRANGPHGLRGRFDFRVGSHGFPSSSSTSRCAVRERGVSTRRDTRAQIRARARLTQQACGRDREPRDKRGRE